MSALRRDDGAAAAGISPAGKDRVGLLDGIGISDGQKRLYIYGENLLAGALDVDILCCSDCGKLEFFRGEWSELEDPEGSGIARMECPSCGRSYELDSPKCPFCGKKNTRLF